MQISSYTFQSPYPQPFQVGRLDPSSRKEDESPGSIEDPQKKFQLSEAKVSLTKETKMNVSVAALLDGNALNGVAVFKSLSTSIQGQKAYAETAS